MKARICGSTRLICARQASVAARDETSRVASFETSSEIVSWVSIEAERRGLSAGRGRWRNIREVQQLHGFRAKPKRINAVACAVFNHVIGNTQRRKNRIKRQRSILGKVLFDLS